MNPSDEQKGLESKTFKCQKCPETFSNVTELRHHTVNSHFRTSPKSKFTCKKCGQGYISSTQMKIHRETDCGTSRKHLCHTCGLGFLTAANLDQHKKVHNGQKNFLCGHCGKKFLSRGELEVHERKHTGVKPFVCLVCKKAFAYRESLVTHGTIHSGIRPYLCACCGRSFSCVGNLLKHKRRKADTCGSAEYSNENAKIAPRVTTKGLVEKKPRRRRRGQSDMEEVILELKHKEEIDLTSFEDEVVLSPEAFEEESKDEGAYFRWNDTNFECLVCETEFSDIETCVEHLKEMHNVEVQIINIKVDDEPKVVEARKPQFKRKYSCQKCGKHFSSRNLLSGHEKSNCGKDPVHICELCGKGYATAGSLKTHQTVHTGELKFSCEFCSKTFRTAGQVKIHSRRHTGVKPFLCQYCEKSFSHRESLLTHETTHTGQRRFGCICGQKFSCISNLIAHRKSNPSCAQLPLITKPIASK